MLLVDERRCYESLMRGERRARGDDREYTGYIYRSGGDVCGQSANIRLDEVAVQQASTDRRASHHLASAQRTRPRARRNEDTMIPRENTRKMMCTYGLGSDLQRRCSGHDFRACLRKTAACMLSETSRESSKLRLHSLSEAFL